MSTAKIKFISTSLEANSYTDIAKQIINDLGYASFITMIGVREFQLLVKDGNGGIKFKLPTNKLKANRCTVTLLPGGIYYTYFTSEWFDNQKAELISNLKTEYGCDSPELLKEMFESYTGLSLTVPTVIGNGDMKGISKAEELGREFFNNGGKKYHEASDKFMKFLSHYKVQYHNIFIDSFYKGYEEEKQASVL